MDTFGGSLPAINDGNSIVPVAPLSSETFNLGLKQKVLLNIWLNAPSVDFQCFAFNHLTRQFNLSNLSRGFYGFIGRKVYR